MLQGPVVVLSEGLEGLRASAWLATRGFAVRHLFVDPMPSLAGWEPLVAGDAGRLEVLLGPTRLTALRPALLRPDAAISMPTGRRQVAALAGLSPWALGTDLLAVERTLPYTLGAWGPQRFGRAAWDAVVAPLLEARTGGPVAELHRGLGPLLTCRPDGPWHATTLSGAEAVARWTDTIRAAGGEVLDHVQVVALEADGPRVVAALTDHGREHAGAIVSDLSPARLARWLPPSDDGDPDGLATADLVQVELAVAAPHETWAVAIHERARLVVPPGPRGIPDRERLWVERTGPGLASEDDRTLAERARAALPPSITVRETLAVVRRPGATPRPTPATEGQVVRWLARLARLGILPIGPRALFVPLSTRDEVDTTVAVLDGVPPAEVRGGRLGLATVRPWVLLQ